MRTPLIVALTAAATLVVASCSSGEGVDAPALEDGSGGGSDELLVAAISAQPDQLDPHVTTAYPSFQVLENVYDTLVVPSAEDLTMEPSLATEWTTSEDGLSWVFTLRDGVTFHDGTSFEAADVVYSFDRIVDEELSTAYRFATVEDVVAQDDRTVVLTLTEPTPNLLSQIGGFKGMAILPEGAADQYDLTTEAVGTGPFQLEGSDASATTLTRFDDYWGEHSDLPGVEFRYITEPAAALTALQNGEVQWTDNVPPQQVAALEGDDAVQLETTASTDYWYMAMNLTKAPFDDVTVRRAIATAVGRASVTEAARFGAARANQTAAPEDSFWYDDYAPFPEDGDLAAAQALMAEAGVTGPLTMGLMVTSEFPETVAAAQVIASQLEPLGITVDIQTEDFATWLDRQGRGDFDAFMLGWLGNIDAADFYDAQHTTDGANNFQGYSNPAVDDLLARAAVETDADARKDLYDQAATTIVDEVSYLYLYNPDVVQAWSPGLEGYEIRADKAVEFENVTITAS